MKQKKWLIVWWFINIILIVALLGDVIYNNFLFQVRDYAVVIYFIIWSIVVINVFFKKIKL